MFQLKVVDAVWWPVIVKIPADGGTTTDVACEAQFRLVEQDEYERLVKQRDSEILAEVLQGWRNIGDAQGNPLEFSAQSRDQLCQIPYARSAFIRAWLNAQAGAVVKN